MFMVHYPRMCPTSNSHFLIGLQKKALVCRKNISSQKIRDFCKFCLFLKKQKKRKIAMANKHEALSSSMLTLIAMVSLLVVVLFKTCFNTLWNQLTISLQMIRCFNRCVNTLPFLTGKGRK